MKEKLPFEYALLKGKKKKGAFKKSSCEFEGFDLL